MKGFVAVAGADARMIWRGRPLAITFGGRGRGASRAVLVVVGPGIDGDALVRASPGSLRGRDDEH
ncbi:MAG: hypothetical protein IPK71_37090 [Myxococcales bacterium]|nr:hypothetical protein [Myxococcales bacterium]